LILILFGRPPCQPTNQTAADTLVILGENDPKQVEALGTWLGLDLDQWFELSPTEDAEADAELAQELAASGPLFPMPCTVRTALSSYCDVNAIPSRALMGKMAQVASRPEHRKRLAFLASKDGKEEYHQWVVERRMNIIARKWWIEPRAVDDIAVIVVALLVSRLICSVVCNDNAAANVLFPRYTIAMLLVDSSRLHLTELNRFEH
jgi:hypothetical protein